MDGLDADEEWSDASEGAVKSGSATDASKGEREELLNRRSCQLLLSSTFSMSSLTKKDPVSHVLEKIDAELAAMSSSPSLATATHPRPPSAARLKSPSPLLTLSWQLKSTGSSDTGFGTGSSRVVVAPDAEQQKEKVAGLAQMYTDPGLTDAATDDDTVGDRLVTDDQPSDLDSLAAAKIDNRFKEIMSRKKGSPSPVSFLHKVSSPSFLSQQEPQFLSLVRLPTGYTTDNESIKTEDFESRFRSLLVTSDGNMVAEPEQASTPRLLGRGSKGKIPGTSTPRKSILSSRGATKADATSKADVDKTGEGLKSPGSKSKLNGIVRTTMQHTMKSLGETTVKWPEETARGPTASLATQSADSAPGNLLPGIRYRSGSDLYQGSQYGDYKATHRPWDEDNLRIGSKGRQLSRGSSASTFDEVESLCLSKSSSDSFNLYRRHGVGVAAGRGGKLLSRQSSTTSTSTSSGHPGEALDKRSQSTSTSGSVHEEGGMETLDPRQQFNLGDPAFLDRIFRRVLDWNNMYGAAGGDMHGKGGGVGTGSGRNFGVLPPSMQAASRATSGSPMMHGSPALGRRAKDMQAKKQMSPTSDITHVKRRRDLIIPDEDEEYPFAPNSLRRPGDLKGRSGGKDSSVGSTTSVSSSKQISSDSFSMMSSGSSMSQDLNWRDQLVHGWREMTGQRYNEQPSSYGMFTRQGSQTWRDHPHYHHQQQQHPPPSTFHPISGMMPPGFMPHPSTFSRGMSVESLGSMGIPSPPAETFRYGNPLQPFPPNQMQNQAEMMLMNLGFGSSDGFLPERFLRDWYNKVMRAQMQSQQQAAPAGAPLDAQDSLYGSASNLHNVDAVRGPQLPNRKPSFDDVGSASDLHHVVHHPSGRLMTSSAASHASSDSHDVAASNLPPVLDKDERIDRLKEYIEAYAQNMSTSSDSRTGRIRQFANARQKSLPLYLETLSEEDEGKARKAAFDPLDKESRLQAFLREDSFSTSGRSESHPSESSGPTSCEQSMCGSESDSMSGSDHQAYINYSRKHGVSGVASVSTFGNPTPGVSHTLTLKVPGYSLAEPSENCVHSETGNDIVKGDGEGLAKTRTHHQPLVNDASFKEVFNESKDCDRHSAVDQHTTESSVSPTSQGTQHHHHYRRSHHHHHHHHHDQSNTSEHDKESDNHKQKVSLKEKLSMIHKAKSDEETVREHRAKSPRHFSNGDRSRSPRLRQDRSKSPISTRSRSPKCHCRDRSKSPCAAEHRSKSPSGHRHKSKDQQHLRPKSPSPRSRIRATSPIKNEGGSHGKHKSEDGARSRNHEKTPKKLRHQRSRRNSMVDNEEQNETSSSQSEHDTCQRKGSEKKSVSTSHMKVAPTPGILRHDVEGSSGSAGVGHARAEDHNLTKTHRNQKSSSPDQRSGHCLSVSFSDSQVFSSPKDDHQTAPHASRQSLDNKHSVYYDQDNIAGYYDKDAGDDGNERGKLDILCSTESLEVADIFKHPGSANTSSTEVGKVKAHIGNLKQVEPAMVSIVLEDVDGNVLENQGSLDEDGLRRLPYHHESTPPDDLLCIPQSRSSSMSLSPVPLSPVTVIEVGLDNQQDSLDTEEGTGSSKDLSEPIDETEEERNDSDEFNREVDLLPREADTLGSETDPGEFPPNIEISLEQRLSSALPFSDTQSESGFEVVVPRKVREVSVAADDGKCSPIFLFGMVSSGVSSPSASSSFSPLSSRQRNIASQADDGNLSPLVKVHDERILEALVENFHGNGYYLVKDCGAQCTISEGMLDMSSEPDIVTTETEVFDSFTQTARLIRYEMSSQTTPVSSSHVHSFSQTDLNTECESRSVSPDFWEYLGLEIPVRLRGTFESENVSLLNVPQNSAVTDNLHVAYSPSLSASPCSIDFPLLDLPGRSAMARLVKPTARAQTACQTDQHLPENNPNKFSWTSDSQPMSLLDVPGNCLRWMEDNLDDGYSRSLSGSPCSIDFPLLDLPGRSAMKRSDKPTVRVQTACQTTHCQPEVFETRERDSSLSPLNHDTVDNIICSQEYSSSQTLLTSPAVLQHRKGSTSRKSPETFSTDYRCEGSCDKAVNTCVSMATQEEEERKAVEQARCFYFKPLPFAEESTRQWPGEDHSSPCAHVSILSFHVDDYRQQDNLQCPAFTPPDREQTVADETTYTCCYNENLLSLNLELMSGHDGTSYATSNDQNKKLVLDLLLLRETKPAPEEPTTVDAIKTDFTEVSEKVSEFKDEDARDGAPMALHENSHSGPIIYNSCEGDNPIISSTLTSHIVVDENLILETAKRLNDERKGKEMSVVEKKQAVLDLFCLRQSQDLDHLSPDISRSATDNPVSNTSDLGSCHVISSPQTCQSSDDKYLFARLFSGDFKESSSKENDCEEVHFEGHDKDVALGLNEEQDKEGKMLNETKEFEEAKKETEELIEETHNQSESSVNVKDQKAGRLFSRMFKTGSFRYSSVDEGIPFTTLTAENTNSRDDFVENLPSKEMVLRRFLLRDTREEMAQTGDGLTREEFSKDTNIPADAAPPQNEAVSERLSSETKDLCQMPSGDNCVEIESKGQKGDIQSTTGNEVCVDVDDDDLSYQGSFSDTCSELSVIFRGHNPSAKSFQVTKVPLTACVISDSHESPASRLLVVPGRKGALRDSDMDIKNAFGEGMNRCCDQLHTQGDTCSSQRGSGEDVSGMSYSTAGGLPDDRERSPPIELKLKRCVRAAEPQSFESDTNGEQGQKEDVSDIVNALPGVIPYLPKSGSSLADLRNSNVHLPGSHRPKNRRLLADFSRSSYDSLFSNPGSTGSEMNVFSSADESGVEGEDVYDGIQGAYAENHLESEDFENWHMKPSPVPSVTEGIQSLNTVEGTNMGHTLVERNTEHQSYSPSECHHRLSENGFAESSNSSNLSDKRLSCDVPDRNSVSSFDKIYNAAVTLIERESPQEKKMKDVTNGSLDELLTDNLVSLSSSVSSLGKEPVDDCITCSLSPEPISSALADHEQTAQDGERIDEDKVLFKAEDFELPYDEQHEMLDRVYLPAAENSTEWKDLRSFGQKKDGENVPSPDTDVSLNENNPRISLYLNGPDELLSESNREHTKRAITKETKEAFIPAVLDCPSSVAEALPVLTEREEESVTRKNTLRTVSEKISKLTRSNACIKHSAADADNGVMEEWDGDERAGNPKVADDQVSRTCEKGSSSSRASSERRRQFMRNILTGRQRALRSANNLQAPAVPVALASKSDICRQFGLGSPEQLPFSPRSLSPVSDSTLSPRSWSPLSSFSVSPVDWSPNGSMSPKSVSPHTEGTSPTQGKSPSPSRLSPSSSLPVPDVILSPVRQFAPPPSPPPRRSSLSSEIFLFEVPTTPPSSPESRLRLDPQQSVTPLVSLQPDDAFLSSAFIESHKLTSSQEVTWPGGLHEETSRTLEGDFTNQVDGWRTDQEKLKCQGQMKSSDMLKHVSYVHPTTTGADVIGAPPKQLAEVLEKNVMNDCQRSNETTDNTLKEDNSNEVFLDNTLSELVKKTAGHPTVACGSMHDTWLTTERNVKVKSLYAPSSADHLPSPVLNSPARSTSLSPLNGLRTGPVRSVKELAKHFERKSELPETVSNQAAEDLDSTAREIERQSAHIQRDMERERRARSVSPIRCLTSSPATLPPRPARPATPARLQTTTTDYGSVNYDSGDVFASSPTVNKDVSENTIAGQELRTLREALFTTRLQLKAAEKEAKEMRDKAEEARSQLMLLEFKRSTAAKELDRLIDEISRKKGMSQLYDSEVQAKLSEIRGFQALGISMETVRLLQEENDTLKLRQRGLRTAELERDELSRQLEAAKEDLLREQKQARLQREELSEEIETLTARLEETQNNLSIAQRTTDKLEDAFRQMEREKNELIQQTTKEYAALKARANQESKESRQLMTREVEVINEELQELRVRVNDLLADNKMKEEQNSQLRENLNALQSQLSQEQASRAAVTEDHRKTLQMLRKETDTAMLQLRESLFLDKQRALEELRAEVESERRDSTSRADERMAQLLGENAALLSEKNQEIARLQEKVRDVQRSVDRRVQEVTDQKMREAVVRESARLESESQWKLRAEREAMTRDAKQMVDEMKMALDQEKELTHHLKREVSQMKEELEEQRRQSREAQKEKLMAVARAKEQTREQGSLELEKVKEKVRQDMQREVDRVQSQLRQAEDEIRTLKSEKQQIVSREKDSQASLDRVEKTVINELNEECRRGATALGVSPRQVQLSAVTESTSTRAQITAALANLRAVNEELRNNIQELSTELERCRSVISELEKEKLEVAEGVRLEMDKKRVLELDRLKEKLSKEHAEELAKVAQASARQSLANSMVTALRRKDQEIEELKNSLQTWRDQTAEKVAHLYKTELARELEKSQAVVSQNNFEQKQVNEMQQREIDRLEREVQRLAMMQCSKPPVAPRAVSPSPLSQQQQQQYLQARIKQLTADNDALRRKQLLSRNNLSVPDLSALSPTQTSPRRPLSPTREPRDKMRRLEDRIRLGEKEAIIAEERAKLSQSLLSHKMAEMTKLQNTLNCQNQELMQLEKAYTQLHRQYNNTPVMSAHHVLTLSR